MELIESGASIIVATRDASLRPECVRGLGATVSDDRRRLTVLLNDQLAGRIRAHLADNGHIAVSFSRIVDHHTIQVKGHAVEVRAGHEAEQQALERYLAAFAEQVSLAGLPRSVVRRVCHERCVAVSLLVEELYDQTPGPGAGAPMTP